MSSTAPVRDAPPALATPTATVDRLKTFIRSALSDAGADRAVVNLSGGIDSTVTATLATEALGPDRVTGLLLPTSVNRSENLADARRLAERLDIDHRTIELQPLLDEFVTAVSSETRDPPRNGLETRSASTTVPVKPREDFEMAVGNTAARLRMAVAYFEANTTGGLVLGTGNRTELLLGYFTKYGDGGVDLLPIGDLYKSEVRQLARHLGVSETIIEKPPTAGLWAGQTDEDELGAPYRDLDTVLWNLIDAEIDPDTVTRVTSVSDELVTEVLDRHADSTHKRRMPPTPTDAPDAAAIERVDR